MSSLEPWLARLDDEWTAGCRNGAELWRRLKTAGFKGSSRVVAEWATRRRRAEVAPSCGPRKCPSSRVIARMMTIARDQLSKDDAVTIATIEAAVPALVTARELFDRFGHDLIHGGWCNITSCIGTDPPSATTQSHPKSVSRVAGSPSCCKHRIGRARSRAPGALLRARPDGR
jgi:hypothetical protein